MRRNEPRKKKPGRSRAFPHPETSYLVASFFASFFASFLALRASRLACRSAFLAAFLSEVAPALSAGLASVDFDGGVAGGVVSFGACANAVAANVDAVRTTSSFFNIEALLYR